MPIIVALILVVISGLVAAAGDFMGQRAARRKVRIGTLRPRYVSRLIAVVSGVLISLATYGALFLLYEDYREALTQYGSVKQRYLEAQAERDKAERELEGMQSQVQQATTQLDSANASILELQESKIALVKEADAKREEVEKLATEVSAKQAQADKAENALTQTNKQLASAKSELARTRSELSTTLGTAATKAMELDQLRQGDIIPKDTLLARVEIPAASAGQRLELIEAELSGIKQRLASELGTVLDPGTDAALASFAAAYPYADPPTDGIVLIRVAANVLAGKPVAVVFSAHSGARLVHAGELLLTLRVADDGARITARGRTPREVPFPDGVDADAMEEALVQCGDEFVAAMLEMGFTRPAGMADDDLAAPVLRIAALGSDLFERERPYIVQLASSADLSASQWPSEVALNVFKEPGS